MKIFISYSRKDETYAVRLHNVLSDRGFEPWFDQDNLLAGQQWRYEIEKAIKESDFCILILSTNSVDNRGYFQVEMKIAFEVLQTIPEEQIYIIPVMINDCRIPSKIQSIHCVDMYKDWELGLEKLFKSIYSQISFEKHTEEFKRKRAYEILDTAYQDWKIFDKKEKYLLKKEDILLLIENLTKFKLNHEYIEYLLYSISYLPNQDEFDFNVLNNWLTKLDRNIVTNIFNELLADQNPKIRYGCVSIIDLLSDSNFLDILTNKLIEGDIVDIRRKILECMNHHALAFPDNLAENILQNDDDWIMQTHILKYFEEYRPCLLVSDGTDFAKEIGEMAKNAGFRLIYKEIPMGYDFELDRITDSFLRNYDLIIVVKGEHYYQSTDNALYLSLQQYVENGGSLFATSWVSWENVNNYGFSNILPFIHIGDSFNENVRITCLPTANDISKQLFPDMISYNASFELLKSKENSVVLLEDEDKIPIFGYLKKGKGTCYYLNTCQHYCFGIMPSPFKSNLTFRTRFQNVFKWIYSNILKKKEKNGC